MKAPDFIIAGTARAGTTALYYYLSQHPQVFLPAVKEPCFYCFADGKPDYKKGRFAFAVENISDYRKLFKDAIEGQMKGDISTPYLYLHERTIANITSHHPSCTNLKVVIILRNPASRAYSQYLWKLRDGREHLSFDDSLRIEQQRMKENYSFDYFYAHRGLYFEQVKSYMNNFKDVKVILYDDFITDFGKTMHDFCRFLRIDPSFSFKRRNKINQSSLPRFAAVGRILTVESKLKFRMLNLLPVDMRTGIRERFNKWNSISSRPDPMSQWAKDYLSDYYRKDILNLQDLIKTDLSAWLIK